MDRKENQVKGADERSTALLLRVRAMTDHMFALQLFPKIDD